MQECLKQLYHLKKNKKVKLHITKNYSESVLKITKYFKKSKLIGTYIQTLKKGNDKLKM